MTGHPPISCPRARGDKHLLDRGWAIVSRPEGRVAVHPASTLYALHEMPLPPACTGCRTERRALVAA